MYHLTPFDWGSMLFTSLEDRSLASIRDSVEARGAAAYVIDVRNVSDEATLLQRFLDGFELDRSTCGAVSEWHTANWDGALDSVWGEIVLRPHPWVVAFIRGADEMIREELQLYTEMCEGLHALADSLIRDTWVSDAPPMIRHVALRVVILGHGKGFEKWPADTND